MVKTQLEGGKMPTEKAFEPLKAGTVVKILHSGFNRAWIAEYRGPLGPKGAHVYRILVQKSHVCISRFSKSRLKCCPKREFHSRQDEHFEGGWENPAALLVI
jgi:hypothetical protein